VTALTVQLDDELLKRLRDLAAAQQRKEADIVREAVADYVRSARPFPIGMGKYHSGRPDASERAGDLIREAVKDGQWP
jgi:hypothetical protein